MSFLSKTENVFKPFVRCRDCGLRIMVGLKRTRLDWKGRIFVDYVCPKCIANPPKEKLGIIKQRISV